MSDGPKATPSSAEPEPLDDIILGEDDDETTKPPPKAPPPTTPKLQSKSPPPAIKGTGPPPPPASAATTEPKKKPSSGKMKAAKQKMTLRIPDDEVSRPQLDGGTPTGGVPAVRPPAPSSPAVTPPAAKSKPPPARDDRFDPAPPIQPQRIISAAPPPMPGADDTVELPGEEVRARMAAITNETAPAMGVDTTNERGWTPYAPNVDDVPSTTQQRNGGATIVDPREQLPSGPPSEEIPIETDDVADSSSEDLTQRRLPDNGPDSEEIKVEDDRGTDPGAESEIDPDDLVSIESLPRPPVGTKAPTQTVGKYPAFKAPTGAAAALMATPSPPAVTPSAPAVTPAAPSGAASSPSVSGATPAAPPTIKTVSAPAPSSAPSTPNAASAPSLAPATPAAAFRPQPGAPPLIVPAVGALAPPPMNETAAHRKKARPWWEELFNDDFIRTMAKISESQIKGEVDFIEESLGCEAGAMVLDLACGTGRHAVELAARGYQVVGYDLSLAMLARASDEAQDRKQKINFVQGDMRDMTFEETFDGVYSWNTSFGYFDEEKNAAVIAKVHKSLKKGGQFLLDVTNRDYVVRQAPSLAWFEGEGCICMDEMQIDFITSRMKVKRTLMMDDGRTKEIEYSIRVYALHELGKLLHDNGFRVAEVSGRTGTPGVFFGCEAPRTLILAEKR